MGDNLAADGAVRIVALDQVEVMGRDGQCQFVARENDPRPFLRGQLQVPLETIESRYPVLKLPLPVLPLLRRDIRPLTWCRRAELNIDAGVSI